MKTMGYLGVGKGGQQVGNGHGKVGKVGNPPVGVAHLPSPQRRKEVFAFSGFQENTQAASLTTCCA